jgi:hypothetical protein
VLDNAVRLNALKIAHDLETCEPILSEFVHEKKLTVLAARYDLDTGEVEWLEAPGHDGHDSAEEPAKGGAHH